MSSSSSNVDPKCRLWDAAMQFMDGRIDYERERAVPYGERELKLGRMRELLTRLGAPQQGLPVVHIAGTKGKGSTAAMVAAVLSAAEYRTGIFTSPHLDRLEERIVIDGQQCTPDEFANLVEQIRPAVEAMDRAAGPGRVDEAGPTYFEIVTAMALLHFAQRRADAVVLEVGLGGRLDATNACDPQVCAITSIGFDHTRQLGNSLESIAGEKAGIIKPGATVVSGVTEPGPRDVIRRVCRERGSPLKELGVDFDFQYHPPRHLEQAPAIGTFDFESPTAYPRQHRQGLPLPLLGRHQAANAAVALAAVGELDKAGWNITEPAVRTGLGQLVWPARVEPLSRRPAVVLDSAHNASSVDALVNVLEESFSVRRRLLVFAASKGKDINGMLHRLAESFDEILFTRYLNNPRACSPEELATAAAKLKGARFRVCPCPADAWQEARSLAKPDDLICVTGSIFIAAEMRQQIAVSPAPLAAAVPAENWLGAK